MRSPVAVRGKEGFGMSRFDVVRWRVPLGFALAAVYIIDARPTRESLSIGLPIAALGLLLRALAAGHIRKNDVLATTGPYRFTRNPLYLGSTVLAVGFVIAAHEWLLAALALLMLLGVYLPVIRREEQFLAAKFGEEFDRYIRRVPRLFPRLWPAPVEGEGRRSTTFSFALYWKHREYNALIGFLALSVVLLVKIWKFPGV